MSKIMRHRLTVFFIFIILSLSMNAQTFIVEKSDTTVWSEYYDGRIWAYRKIGDFVVGMTNYREKDNYGKYYQIGIFVKNLGDMSVTFDPDAVTSVLYDKRGDTHELEVYTFERYMKKVKTAQAWSMAIMGLAAGMNAGMAGYQRTYTTSYTSSGMAYTQVHNTYNYAAASAANMATTMQMITLGKMMENDRNMKSQGYLRITTIHPDEGIVGYMNIKQKKGQTVIVNIPVNGQIYSFEWDLTKKK